MDEPQKSDTTESSEDSLGEQIKVLIASHKAEREEWAREKRRLEAAIAVLRPCTDLTGRLNFRSKWLGLLALIGWIFFAIAVIWLSLGLVGRLGAMLSGVDRSSIPFDPVAGVVRTGACYEEPRRVCIEMPTEQALNDASGSAHYHNRVTFWNSTKDVAIESALKKMAITKAGEALEVLTTRGPANLVDLRNSMMRRIVRREYDFTCATFFGFPIDYCILLLNGSSHGRPPSSHRYWLDVVGNVRPTHLSYETIIVEASVAPGLCEHAGTGQSPRHAARYFKSMCFAYKNLLGQHEERCVSGSDAAVVQQLYEMQWGMLSCCDDPGRLARLLWRTRMEAG